jgi:hypothetical protein
VIPVAVVVRQVRGTLLLSRACTGLSLGIEGAIHFSSFHVGKVRLDVVGPYYEGPPLLCGPVIAAQNTRCCRPLEVWLWTTWRDLQSAQHTFCAQQTF